MPTPEPSLLRLPDTGAALALADLDAFDAQQNAISVARMQALAWEVLRFWTSFPEVDHLSLNLLVREATRVVRRAPGLASRAHDDVELEWSMSSDDGRDKLEEYSFTAPVGTSIWDQGHAQTGNRSPYGAWATNRLLRWGLDEHASVRAFVSDLASIEGGLHRNDPVLPLVGILERCLPGGVTLRETHANAWAEQARAWCIAQEQAQLRTVIAQDSTASVSPSRPRGRL